MKKNVFLINGIFFFTIIVTILLSCKKDKNEEDPILEPKDGEYRIKGQELKIPNSTIYLHGDSYQTSIQFPFGEICTVIHNDSVFFIYNDGNDTITPLNRKNSIISLFKLMINEYESNQLKMKSFEYNLKTGVSMIQLTSNNYKFKNLKARWAGVENDQGSHSLIEDKDLLPELNLGGLISTSLNVSSGNEPELQVNQFIKSYGSPLRAFISPIGGFNMLINNEFRTSIENAKNSNEDFFKLVVYADAISLFGDAARKLVGTVIHVTDIAGAPLGACNNFVENALVGPLESAAWGFITATDQTQYQIAKDQILQIGAQFFGSQVECIGQAVCSGSTIGGCQLLGEIYAIIDDLYNDFALIVNLLAGFYDANTTLAYDTYYLNPLQNGLVAYYPFNGNVNDESENENNGTLMGSPTLVNDRFGSSNSAYSFNGENDWIKVSHSGSFDFDIGNSYTFSLWVKIPPTTKSEMGIIEKWDGYMTHPYPITIRVANGKIGFAIYQQGLGWNGVDGTSSTQRLDNDTWLNIACVKDGSSSLKLYINGVLDSEDNSLLNVTTYNNHYFMFANYWGNYLLGSMDDIRIYNRALSSDEIQQLYHEGGWTK